MYAPDFGGGLTGSDGGAYPELSCFGGGVGVGAAGFIDMLANIFIAGGAA